MADGLHLALTGELDRPYFDVLYDAEDEAQARAVEHASRAAYQQRLHEAGLTNGDPH